MKSIENCDPIHPGYSKNTASPHEDVNNNRVNAVIDFMQGGIRSFPAADIGEKNKFVELLSKRLGAKIESIEVADLNFDTLITERDFYGTIFCFEVLEHLQNPLFLLSEIKKKMLPDTILYLSMPCKPMYLLGAHHYFEMKPDHFQKWLLTPLGMIITDKKKISFRRSWTEYLIGLRPLIRLFTTKNGWKEVLTTLFYNYTIIYKINLKN